MYRTLGPPILVLCFAPPLWGVAEETIPTLVGTPHKEKGTQTADGPREGCSSLPPEWKGGLGHRSYGAWSGVPLRVARI